MVLMNRKKETYHQHEERADDCNIIMNITKKSNRTFSSDRTIASSESSLSIMDHQQHDDKDKDLMDGVENLVDSKLNENHQPSQEEKQPVIIKSNTRKTSSSTLSTTNSSRKGIATTVSFGTIEIREYNRVLGDWLDIPNGLAIGWEYNQHHPELLPKVKLDQQQHKNNSKNTRVKKGLLSHVLQRVRSSRNKSRIRPPPRPPILPKRKTVSQKAIASSSSSMMPFIGSNNNNNKRYDKTPTTSWQRVDILNGYGFDGNELEQAELHREKTKFEQYLRDNMPKDVTLNY